MTEHDYNGHRIKPGHSGEPRGHPTGPYRDRYVWLLARHDDKLYGYWESRHAAVGARATLRELTVPNKPGFYPDRDDTEQMELTEVSTDG